ncbi:hypothetical protein ABKN59_002743 [Abortiporus biennis]
MAVINADPKLNVTTNGERIGYIPCNVFRVASPLWGYLPQVHEWSKGALEWEAERVDGVEHMPVFKAIPIYRGERLESYARTGNSKKAAKEEAAKAMALSGHC